MTPECRHKNSQPPSDIKSDLYPLVQLASVIAILKKLLWWLFLPKNGSLKAFNFRTFSRGTCPQIPLAAACLRIQLLLSPPNLKYFPTPLYMIGTMDGSSFASRSWMVLVMLSQTHAQIPPSHKENQSGESCQISWASAHFCNLAMSKKRNACYARIRTWPVRSIIFLDRYTLLKQIALLLILLSIAVLPSHSRLRVRNHNLNSSKVLKALNAIFLL